MECGLFLGPKDLFAGIYCPIKWQRQDGGVKDQPGLAARLIPDASAKQLLQRAWLALGQL